MNKIRAMLPADCVLLGQYCPNKKILIEKICEVYVARDPKLNKHKLFKKFIEREQLGTTDIDKGVAIPHIRATDIAKPMAIFIQLMTPVLYNESEAIRCHLILSLLVPEDNPDDHLNLLAYFTKQFHSGTIREQLSLCQQPETAVNIFAHAYELQTAA